MDKIEEVKEQIDAVVAEVLRDVSGVDACRYYTDKILSIPEICQLFEPKEEKMEYLYIRCRFCKEYLFGEPKYIDGSIDDMTHGICANCWQEIGEVFKISGFANEEIQRCERIQSQSQAKGK